MSQEWFFYILRCRDNSLYSGITNNLKARLREHNGGTGAKYTYSRRPVTLVYSERYDNLSRARQREAQIKDWTKTKKERLIAGLALRRPKLSDNG
ncbi:MAG: GIY-YIG nuclease family protein [Chloroflexi bacterium]|nr:GIY-YIG nuclease family protein [Chloroflexota bacterium]